MNYFEHVVRYNCSQNCYYLTVITVIMGDNIVVLMHCWDYVVIRGGSRNEAKGGTLLLAGDSLHSMTSIGSGGVHPQENFDILAL